MHRFSGTMVSNKQVPKLDPLAVVRGSFLLKRRFFLTF